AVCDGYEFFHKTNRDDPRDHFPITGYRETEGLRIEDFWRGISWKRHSRAEEIWLSVGERLAWKGQFSMDLYEFGLANGQPLFPLGFRVRIVPPAGCVIA